MVTEVTFTLAWNGIKDLPWVALVDVETLAVLYLRAFIDGVNGLVFMADPITTNGGPLPGGAAAVRWRRRAATASSGRTTPLPKPPAWKCARCCRRCSCQVAGRCASTTRAAVRSPSARVMPARCARCW